MRYLFLIYFTMIYKHFAYACMRSMCICVCIYSIWLLKCVFILYTPYDRQLRNIHTFRVPFSRFILLLRLDSICAILFIILLHYIILYHYVYFLFLFISRYTYKVHIVLLLLLTVQWLWITSIWVWLRCRLALPCCCKYCAFRLVYGKQIIIKWDEKKNVPALILYGFPWYYYS